MGWHHWNISHVCYLFKCYELIESTGQDEFILLNEIQIIFICFVRWLNDHKEWYKPDTGKPGPGTPLCLQVFNPNSNYVWLSF